METIILINRDDSKDGYFRFSTSSRYDYERLINRIGGEQELLSLRIVRSKGQPVEWTAKVPIKLFSKTYFGIRRNGSGKLSSPSSISSTKKETDQESRNS